MADEEQGDDKTRIKVTATYAGETIALKDDADVETLRNEVFNAVHRGGDWVTLPVAKGEDIVFVSVGTAVTVQSQKRSSKPRVGILV